MVESNSSCVELYKAPVQLCLYLAWLVVFDNKLVLAAILVFIIFVSKRRNMRIPHTPGHHYIFATDD